ncbi:MAG: glycosyltransferase family 2 protein [Rhodospirillaceae bacterium]
MSVSLTSHKRPDYAVVVPVLNEAGNIKPLVLEVVAAMSALSEKPSFEIIYVDDGSTDGTAEELDAVKASVPTLRVFHHIKTTGQSQSLITGILRAQADWIITLDGDGQNDPGDFQKLISARESAIATEPHSADEFIYVGHRRLRRDSLARRYQSWLANDIRGWILGDHTPDSGCGLKLFSRELFLSLPRFDALHRFLPALVIRAGGRAISVPVTHRPRLNGISKYGLWRRLAIGIVDLIGVTWLIARHTRPTIIEQKDSS